jgi:ATP-dependent DNA helicase RecQ
VHSVGEHLATIGRLTWLGPLRVTGAGPRGRPGGNSAFRLAGLWQAFEPTPEQAQVLQGLDGPVLLVDDLADSRWTLTVAGRALRRAGADGVLPFVLAVPA